MPDPDRFEGVAEALAAADAAREEGPPAEDDDETAATGVADATEPAFPFDATAAHSVYVRPETLDAVDDVEALVDARLRTERDIRNLATREYFEAVLQVAIDDPDAIVERVIANRREATEDE